MCWICKRTPCQVSCPHENTSSYEKCAECGGAIYEGQDYYKLTDYYFHEECIGNIDTRDILDMLRIQPYKMRR